MSMCANSNIVLICCTTINNNIQQIEQEAHLPQRQRAMRSMRPQPKSISLINSGLQHTSIKFVYVH